ncbi:hypothetical protein D9R08_09545 [Rhodophyticola porphyridii]|uniref:Glycosyltransferase family 1 protein n=2 Tax=Rhodophyticola porphyridii TaxID=1852017 RepID=A0A3L9Y0F3_9RHOB|nr:hypothetical protein D9R08_09545 [Rhodophyticola porphyridii]
MFKGRGVARAVADACHALELPMDWDPLSVSADLVVLHNPSFLKFNASLDTRIIARHLVVVAHENFLRPGGHEAFDVLGCLGRIDQASVALRKSIAPVSEHNRKIVEEWLANDRLFRHWDVLDENWFNICDFDLKAPTRKPADRRGRLSRPGFEKFPKTEDLDLCFSEVAEKNVILGADTLIYHGIRRPHWTLLKFAEIAPEQFFGMIDFMVYFTAPTWRESFGRVIAEAIAAGKVVICDRATGSSFPGAVLTASPKQVDQLIFEMINNPEKYVKQVKRAQGVLANFSSRRFIDLFSSTLQGAKKP